MEMKQTAAVVIRQASPQRVEMIQGRSLWTSKAVTNNNRGPASKATSSHHSEKLRKATGWRTGPHLANGTRAIEERISRETKIRRKVRFENISPVIRNQSAKTTITPALRTTPLWIGKA